MTSSILENKSCLLFKKGSLKEEDIVWETKCVDGLYPVEESSLGTTALTASKKSMEEEYKKWHEVVGHISSNRFQTLSNLVPDVPSFARTVTNNLHCIQCITAKMKKAPIKSTNNHQPNCAEIHFDLSGPLKDSFNKNKYAIHLLDARTSISEVYCIQLKSQTSTVIRGFISIVNNCFAKEGVSVLQGSCRQREGKSSKRNSMNFVKRMESKSNRRHLMLRKAMVWLKGWYRNIGQGVR